MHWWHSVTTRRTEPWSSIPTPDIGERAAERPLAIAAAAARCDVPVCAVWLGGWLEGPGSDVLDADRGLIVFRSLRRCMLALARWQAWHERRASRPAAPVVADPAVAERVRELVDAAIADEAPVTGSFTIDEQRSCELLATVGIPLVEAEVASTHAEAANVARRIGFPVVVKAVTADIPHKSDVGAVVLGVGDPEAVIAACNRIDRNIDAKAPHARRGGYLVSAMEVNGFEALVGATRDPLFGVLVAGGEGGTASEPCRREHRHRTVDA